VFTLLFCSLKVKGRNFSIGDFNTMKDEGIACLEQMINQITGVNDASSENEPSTSVSQPAAERIDMITSTSHMVKSSDKVTSSLDLGKLNQRSLSEEEKLRNEE